MAMGPMGGRGMRPAEKSKRGLRGVQRELFSYSEKIRLPMLIALVLAAAGAVLTILGPNQLSKITNLISDSLMGEIDLAAIGRVAGVLLGIYALSAMLTYIEHYIMATVTLGLSKQMRRDLCAKINRVPMSCFNRIAHGDILSRVTNDVSTLQQALSNSLPSMISAVAQLTGCVIMMFVTEWRMALAALISAALGNMVYYGMMFGRGEVMKEYMMSNANMNATIVEYVNGMEVIKAFNQTASSMGRFQSAVLKVRDITTKWYRHCWPFMSISQAILPSSIAFVLPVGMALISGGAVSLAELIVCILLSMAIVGSLQNFTEFWESFAVISEVQPRIQALLDMEELTEPAQPKHTDKADMQMKDVHFGYGDSEIIHGISFTAKAGSVTAFVGPSGSGKSTLAKLIARFWDVDAGAVLVGGIDIREMSLTDLTEKISYVSQDNFLFNMSLRDNIRIGKPEATDKEVEWAAAQAGCDEFISRFPQGYDTNAGDAGARLSGGERQRLAIARAILKNAPIVILDEATAFTDPENEDKLQRSIDKLTKGKTLIVIAHRLSTIMYADQILVLENGQITAQGTHEQLLTHSETYLDMWKAHISAMDWSMNQEVSELC